MVWFESGCLDSQIQTYNSDCWVRIWDWPDLGCKTSFPYKSMVFVLRNLREQFFRSWVPKAGKGSRTLISIWKAMASFSIPLATMCILHVSTREGVEPWGKQHRRYWSREISGSIASPAKFDRGLAFALCVMLHGSCCWSMVEKVREDRRRTHTHTLGRSTRSACNLTKNIVPVAKMFTLHALETK